MKRGKLLDAAGGEPTVHKLADGFSKPTTQPNQRKRVGFLDRPADAKCPALILIRSDYQRTEPPDDQLPTWFRRRVWW